MMSLELRLHHIAQGNSSSSGGWGGCCRKVEGTRTAAASSRKPPLPMSPEETTVALSTWVIFYVGEVPPAQ